MLMMVLIILPSSNILAANASKAKKNRTRIKAEYFKKDNNVRQIKATASSRINRKPVKLKLVPIKFYANTDTLQLLGTVVTDEKGVATFTLPAGFEAGQDGTLSFKVDFEGNETFKPATKKIEVKDVKLNATYSVVDSTYTVNVTAFEWANGTQGNPVSDVDVYVYVQRIFSLLKIGEGWLADGKATVEIPNDIPGDRAGNLKLVTMIPDADGYGTVQTGKTVKWGKPLPAYNKYADESKRALWEPRAPLWMVITLAILLLGVFYHYFLIGYKLYKIKKIGKSETA